MIKDKKFVKKFGTIGIFGPFWTKSTKTQKNEFVVFGPFKGVL